MEKTPCRKDRVAYRLFAASVLSVLLAYSFAVGRYELFPFVVLEQAAAGITEIKRHVGVELPYWYQAVTHKQKGLVRHETGAWQGINLVTSVEANNRVTVKLMDMDGKTVHDWAIDWFDIWADQDHLPEVVIPRSRPGTHVHGAVIMEDGDLVFNFEGLGMVRLTPAGDVVWRLPYRTHHSIHRHTDGNLWVCGQKHRPFGIPGFPACGPPIEEYTVLEVTPLGRVVRELSVFDLLKQNQLTGLLHMGSLDDRNTRVIGDTLHLNDVERFPADMTSGSFDEDDIAISLRNINAVFVVDINTLKIKFSWIGNFVRQHDPDFVDGDTLTVYDNHNLGDRQLGSRIVRLSARDGEIGLVYQGSTQQPFYSDIMGKHQWLANGNLLITESIQGRAFEVTPSGEIVWEFINYVGVNTVGIVEEVTRLPWSYASLYQQYTTTSRN